MAMSNIEDFYNSYYERLLKYIAGLERKKKTNPDVEDLSSDTWVKVFLKWDQCYADSDKGRYGWVCQIARHVRARMIEKEVRRCTSTIDPTKLYVTTFRYPYDPDTIVAMMDVEEDVISVIRGREKGYELKEISRYNGWKDYKAGYIIGRNKHTIRDILG